MPTYDYECSSCGHAFEIFERIDAGSLKKCLKCGKKKAKRQIGTGAGVVFKGSGFYTTDYARKGDPSKKEKKDGAEKTEGSESKKKTTEKDKKPKKESGEG